MKRRNFFKKFGIGVTALVVAPKILAEVIKEDIYDGRKVDWTLVDEIGKFPRIAEMNRGRLKPNEYYLKGESGPFGIISFKTRHHLRANDVILVYMGSNFNKPTKRIATEVIDEFTIRTVGLSCVWSNPSGEVFVLHLYREFHKGTSHIQKRY